MAYDYEKIKQQYEALSPDKQKQFADMNKNDSTGNFQKFMNQYNAEKNQTTNTAKTTGTTVSKNTTSNSSYWVPTEYQPSWTNKSNNYVNQWQGNYAYDEWTKYYEKQGWNQTYPSNTNVVNSVRDAWNAKSYEEQQELLKSNPKMQETLTKYGITNKEQWTPTWAKGSEYANQWEWQYQYNPKTWYYEKVNQGATQWGNQPTNQGWDYQDNSPERMAEILRNLDDLSKTNPWLFSDYNSFYNAFIAWKGRSQEQIDVLNDYFNKMKQYNKYNNMSSDDIWAWLVNWTIPEDYLNYLKYNDPQRYAEIQEARKKGEDKIKADASIDTIGVMTGEIDEAQTSTWKVIEWLKAQWLFVDKDWNLIDDRTENYASEEELGYQKEIADINARNLDIDNTVKHTYDDLVERYPWASKATLMAMAQDMNSDLLREKENNLVQLTKLQGYVNYMQQEREDRTQSWKDSISQLQKEYGMYYDYSPEWMSELAQAQYAATNVTLDQADNGTDTQKQMALDSVLSDYYDKYWSIIQRSKNQVINDVMAYAKNNGVSLSQALEDNFLKYLRQKPWYNDISNWGATSDEYTLSSYEWPDWTKHIVRFNKNTWQWDELSLWDIVSDIEDIDWLTSTDRNKRKQALFNLAQQADTPEEQAQLIAAAMQWNYAGTCWAYANDINYAITWDRNWIFGNDVKQKEWVCDNTEWWNIKAWDFVVFNYQKIPWVSRNTVPSWLWWTDLETWQDMYDHGHVWYVTWVDAQWNITMTHTKSQIATTSTFNKNTKLGQALYGSYTPVWWYDKAIPDSIYKAVWTAAEKWDFKTLDDLAKRYWYTDSNALVRQYERQYQDSIVPVTEWLLKKIDQLIAATKDTSKSERVLTLSWEWSYVNSAWYAAYKSLLNDYALDKLSNMTVKLSPMSDTDVKIVASASNAFMNEWYRYDNDDYFRDLQNIRDSIISRSPVLQKKYWDTNSWNWQKQYYDWTTKKFTTTKPRWVLWGNQ